MGAEHDDYRPRHSPPLAPPFASRRLYVLIALSLAAIVSIFSFTWAAAGIGVLAIWYGTLWIENVDLAHAEMLHRLERLEALAAPAPLRTPIPLAAEDRDEPPIQVELPN